MRELVRAAGLLLVLVSVVTSQDCTTGEARLADNGNTDTNRKIVQVCYNGGWTTVCGRNRWSINSANVVCRQLGYSEYGAIWSWYYTDDRQTRFSGVRQYTYLPSSCRGDERVLTDCALVLTNCYYESSRHNDAGYYYATVTCQPNTCDENEIRLVGGASYREGRVEVCVDGRWGTVCGEGWTNKDAGHVCTRLGYPSTGATNTSFGEGTGPVYDIQCQQDSSDECLPTVVTSTHCTDHTQDLGVRCKSYNEVYEDECTEECEAEINERLSSLTTNSGSTNTLGALLGLLGVTLAAVLVGWIMTCVYCHRKINKQIKDHTHPDSQSDPALQLNNPAYDVSAPPPHTTYSSLGPSYENNQGAGHSYDIITRPHPPTTLTVPPEHEYGVLEGPAHTPGGGVVEGTYSLVGESDPQDYEIPTPTTEGGQDYSKLQH